MNIRVAMRSNAYKTLFLICVYKVYYIKYAYYYFFYIFMPSWRNWISRLTSNQKSVGSNPTGGNKMFIWYCLIHLVFPIIII